MQKVQKMRIRNHQVVLNRSVGGDAGIFVFLAIMGVFMFLPMVYVIMQSLKPLDELLSNEVFSGFESKELIPTAVMGAVAGHATVKYLLHTFHVPPA